MHPNTASSVPRPVFAIVVPPAALFSSIEPSLPIDEVVLEDEAAPEPALGADLVGGAARRPMGLGGRLAERPLHTPSLEGRRQVLVLDGLLPVAEALYEATVGPFVPPLHAVGGGEIQDEVALRPLFDLGHASGVLSDPQSEVVDVELVRMHIQEDAIANLHHSAGGDVGARCGDITEPPVLLQQLVCDGVSVQRVERRWLASRAIPPP
mmetsp:Transcript_35162/g.101251  ORF Transcript_35162/g.101251 Transcript_35162/m.101251 type:complete len:209 (-) Transcript_35162:1308-1934(-)